MLAILLAAPGVVELVGQRQRSEEFQPKATVIPERCDALVAYVREVMKGVATSTLVGAGVLQNHSAARTSIASMPESIRG